MKKLLLLCSLAGLFFTACEMENEGDGIENYDYTVPDSPLNEYTCAPNEILYITTNGKMFDTREDVGYDSPYFDSGEEHFASSFGGGHLDQPAMEEYGIDENGVGKIIFENDIEAIPGGFFCDWRNLMYIKLPDTIKSIGHESFAGCVNLKGIAIPGSVTSMDVYGPFYGCPKLAGFYGKYATSDNRCLIVNSDLVAFAPAGLTEYSIPANVTRIKSYTFKNCKTLESVTIPKSVTMIQTYAFEGCSGLTNITISDGVSIIGDYAFASCTSLTSITIPNSVTSLGSEMGGGVFCKCSNLEAFYGKFASSDNRCLIIDGSLVAFAPAGLTEYAIPNGVSSIKQNAIAYCENLTTLTIPESVTRIYSYAIILANRKSNNVYCKPLVPPTLDYGGIGLYKTSAVRIYVPTESVEAYKTAEGGWGDFLLVQEVIVGYDF